MISAAQAPPSLLCPAVVGLRCNSADIERYRTTQPAKNLGQHYGRRLLPAATFFPLLFLVPRSAASRCSLAKEN